MLRPSLDSLPASRIREVADHYANEAARGRAGDLVKFWFGEGDLATPEFIRAAAKASIDAGETFYNHNLGIVELRTAVAGYVDRLHRPRTPIDVDRVAITSAGVNALLLVSQALLEPGDRVAIVTPVWPNVTSQPRIMGAQVVRVPLTCAHGAWSLDLARLLDAARPGTRMVVVNSPNNPTGWVMSQAQWQALRAHCRQHGIWLVAPRGFIANFAKMVEFNTSCAPTFVQRAGIAAIRDGDQLIRETVARLHGARDLLVARLTALPGVEAEAPPGAMYLFFRIRGASDDSLACAKELVAKAGLGLAPGIAFGPEGEGYLRWCFAATHGLIERGVERLADALRRRHS